MSAISDSTLGSAYSSMASAGDRLRKLDLSSVATPVAALAGAEEVASAVGDVASTTVTLSADALSGIGDVVSGVAGYVSRGVDDVENAASAAWNWAENAVGSAVTGAANLVVGAIELPFKIVGDVVDAAESIVGDGVDLGCKAVSGTASLVENAGGKFLDAIV